MFQDHLIPQQETKEVKELQAIRHQFLNDWVELMRSSNWNLNVQYVKDRIIQLERELVKVSGVTSLDNAMQSMAIMRSIKEFKSLLSHYETLVTEKMHYDEASANSSGANKEK